MDIKRVLRLIGRRLARFRLNLAVKWQINNNLFTATTNSKSEKKISLHLLDENKSRSTTKNQKAVAAASNKVLIDNFKA